MATLKQIQAKLKKLQSQTESLIAQRAQAVLDDIRALMERHGLTTADIDSHRRRNQRAAAKPNVAFPAPAERRENMKSLAKKGKLPAKYRNPKTGETWSGWARPPAWIAGVKDRSKFLIDAEGNETAAQPKKTTAKKAAAKKAPAKKAAAKKTAAPSTTAKAKKTASPRASTTAAKKTSAAKTAKPAVKRKRSAAPAAPADVGGSPVVEAASAPEASNESSS